LLHEFLLLQLLLLLLFLLLFLVLHLKSVLLLVFFLLVLLLISFFFLSLQFFTLLTYIQQYTNLSWCQYTWHLHHLHCKYFIYDIVNEKPIIYMCKGKKFLEMNGKWYENIYQQISQHISSKTMMVHVPYELLFFEKKFEKFKFKLKNILSCKRRMSL